MKKKLLTISIALFILTLSTNRMFAQNWNFQTIVPSVTISSTDIKLDNNSYPHVIYIERTEEGYSDYWDYFYATWNGIAWTIESVPDNVKATHAQFCLDQNNDPHIIHSYNASGLQDKIKYTYRDSTGFLITQSIESVTYSIISAYFRNDILEFLASGDDNIYQYTYDNQSNLFTKDTIEPGIFPCGHSYKSVIDDDFDVYFAYQLSNNDVRFGFFDGETVSSFFVAEWGFYPSITLDNEGIPHISYYDYFAQDLIHARLPAQAVEYLKSLKNKKKQTANYVAE